MEGGLYISLVDSHCCVAIKKVLYTEWMIVETK